VCGGGVPRWQPESKPRGASESSPASIAALIVNAGSVIANNSTSEGLASRKPRAWEAIICVSSGIASAGGIRLSVCPMCGDETRDGNMTVQDLRASDSMI